MLLSKGIDISTIQKFNVPTQKKGTEVPFVI